MDVSLFVASPHLWNQLNSLLHSANLIVFTVLVVHIILRISLHHSHHLRSHHLSLPRPFTPDLKLISFTNPFLHSHSYSFRTDFTDLNLYCIKGGTGVVCFSFFFWLRVLDKSEYSAFESTLNSSIVSYRIVFWSIIIARAFHGPTTDDEQLNTVCPDKVYHTLQHQITLAI